MIRLATPGDRPQFMALWAEFLTDQRKQGSHIHDSVHNLNIYRGYFDAYTRGSLMGDCFLWFPDDAPEEPQGVLLVGEDWSPDNMETDLGKTAKGWGVYVRPAYRGRGVGEQLRRASVPVGLRRGCDTVENLVLATNKPGELFATAMGFGSKYRMVWFTANLKESLALVTASGEPSKETQP